MRAALELMGVTVQVTTSAVDDEGNVIEFRDGDEVQEEEEEEDRENPVRIDCEEDVLDTGLGRVFALEFLGLYGEMLDNHEPSSREVVDWA